MGSSVDYVLSFYSDCTRVWFSNVRKFSRACLKFSRYPPFVHAGVGDVYSCRPCAAYHSEFLKCFLSVFKSRPEDPSLVGIVNLASSFNFPIVGWLFYCIFKLNSRKGWSSQQIFLLIENSSRHRQFQPWLFCDSVTLCHDVSLYL